MRVYNTLTRQIEEFIPRDNREIKMYTCGPTVYNYAHVGNLRTYISEDILEKVFNYLGYNVKRVMNITDVGHLESDSDTGEDKMLKGAKRENKTVWEISEFYTETFFDDCKKLNIKRPEIVSKATDNINECIKIIKGLEEKGYTYFTSGNVYFDISKFPNYTRLSRMNLDELKVASRNDVTEDINKKNPQDFVLWFTKSKFDNQAMKWNSPWGVGYPGWHIECSAISLRFLGEKLDIHCGGVDHIPVHHTNEIAQTESYTGRPWVKYWWHGEFLVDETGKMSKSKGEFLTLSLLESKGYNPLAYRFFCLGSHYRRQLVFSYESLDTASSSYEKLLNKVRGIKEDDSIIAEKAMLTYKTRFSTSLEDDLNTANALTTLFDMLKDDNLNNNTKLLLIEDFDKVLSLDLLKKEKSIIDESFAREIDSLITERDTAKANKNYARADEIRNYLLSKGVIIKDSREGTIYEIKEVK